MTLQKKKIKRVFRFNGKELSDPNPNASVEDVIQNVFSKQYPSLTNAKVEGPYQESENDVYKIQAYKVSAGFGTKG